MNLRSAGLYVFAAPALFFAVFIALVSCRPGAGTGSLGEAGDWQPGAGTPQSPAEVKELAEYLSGVLEEKRIEFGTADRTASAPPAGASGKVSDLNYDSGAGLLTWSYRNTGDYDLSGEVGVSDITPIALHYLAITTDTIGNDPLEAWIDGDLSGEVAVGDITPIAVYFLNQVAGYRILTSDAEDGTFSQIGSDVSFGVSNVFPKTFSAPLPSGALAFVAVAPLDSSGALGIRSNAVPVSGDVAPVISSVMPQGGDSGGIVQFSAIVKGAFPLAYAWDFGGGAIPNATIDPSPTVTLAASGIYNASVTVTNSEGSDTFNFNLYVVGGSTPPQIYSVSPMSGESGTQVTFSAEVSGSSPLSFAWDFGGGAVPDSSASPLPSVTLSAAGAYDCTLVVSNAYGSDIFDFALDVVPYNAPPVPVASVTPIVGDSPVTATLLASGSSDPDGSIVLYEWDFEDDGIYDYSSASSAPIEHVYPGEAAGGPWDGRYRARLRVTDDGGKTATAQTPDFISNDAHLYWTWEYVDGGAAAGYQVSSGTTLIDPRDGRPCIVYRAEDAGWKIKAAWRNFDGTYYYDQLDFGYRFSLSNAAMLPDGTIVVAVYWFNSSSGESQLSAVWRSPEGIWTSQIVDEEGKYI